MSAVEATSHSALSSRRLVTGVNELSDTSSMSQPMEQDLRYKTVLCTRWSDAGSCHLGTHCKFAHGQNELRTHASNAARNALAVGGGTLLVAALFEKVYAVCDRDAAKAER